MRHDKNQLPCGSLAYVWKDIVGNGGWQGPSFDELLRHLLPSCLGERPWVPPEEQHTERVSWWKGSCSSCVSLSTWTLHPTFYLLTEIEEVSDGSSWAGSSIQGCAHTPRQVTKRARDFWCALCLYLCGNLRWDTTSSLASHLSLLAEAHLKQN